MARLDAAIRLRPALYFLRSGARLRMLTTTAAHDTMPTTGF
jgi:hypothetical protein